MILFVKMILWVCDLIFKLLMFLYGALIVLGTIAWIFEKVKAII